MSHFQLSPHRVSKKSCTAHLSTFLSMLAAYTVRLHSSRSSIVRGRYWLFTGTMAVLEGSTLIGYCPSTVPFFVSACRHRCRAVSHALCCLLHADVYLENQDTHADLLTINKGPADSKSRKLRNRPFK